MLDQPSPQIDDHLGFERQWYRAELVIFVLAALLVGAAVANLIGDGGLGSLAGRAALMYVVVLMLLRLTTRRLMRSATPIDMAIVFLFGGLAIQAVMAGEQSMLAALVAMCSISLMHFGISIIKRYWPILGMVTEGTPVIIYDQGHWYEERLRGLRLQKQDVMAEARQQGLQNLAQVDYVAIEHNGGISIVREKRNSAI